MAEKETLVELQDLSKSFKVSGGILKAVNHINLTIKKGETLGLVGESGCGKSTLGRVVMGVYQPTTGKVIYNGEELNIKTSKDRYEYAKKAFKVLECSGMARVDFFLDKETEEIYINEVNTIPGFTKNSSYPKLLGKKGIAEKDIIDKLIEYAINE